MIKDNNGQIMIESIIAITVGVIALTGILNLLTNSLGVNRDVGQRFTATYLAMEGVEITKSLIDANYANGQPWNRLLSDGSYEFQYNTIDPTGAEISGGGRSNNVLYFDSSDGIYSYDTNGTETRFKRTIFIDNMDRGDDPGADEMKVRSLVEWPEGDSTREIIIEDHFFDWRL